MWPVRSGQQKVHEYEALRDDPGKCLNRRLTSFARSLQTNLRKTLDTATPGGHRPIPAVVGRDAGRVPVKTQRQEVPQEMISVV